jgi:hypothetical protein
LRQKVAGKVNFSDRLENPNDIESVGN